MLRRLHDGFALSSVRDRASLQGRFDGEMGSSLLDAEFVHHRRLRSVGALGPEDHEDKEEVHSEETVVSMEPRTGGLQHHRILQGLRNNRRGFAKVRTVLTPNISPSPSKTN